MPGTLIPQTRVIPWCPSARASSAPRTPETLASRGDLATWTGPSGDRAAVRDQFADLAPVCKTILGAEHPDTLDSGNLATWTGWAGDPAAARDQLTGPLPAGSGLGPEHPETLTISNNLAPWSGRAGDPAAVPRDRFAELSLI